MAYTKQGFKDGQVLNAEQLNKIEQELARVKSYHELSDSPFGDEEVTIFPETAVEFTLDEDMGAYMAVVSFDTMPIVGNKYKVVWNGTEYNCEYLNLEGVYYLGNASVFGLEDTGEPFLISQDNGFFGILSFVEDTNIMLSISGIHAKLLDSKYLPDLYTLDLATLGLESVNTDSYVDLALDSENYEIVKKAAKQGLLKIIVPMSVSYKNPLAVTNNETQFSSNYEIIANLNATYNDFGSPFYYINELFYNIIVYIDISSEGYVQARARKITLE